MSQKEQNGIQPSNPDVSMSQRRQNCVPSIAIDAPGVTKWDPTSMLMSQRRPNGAKLMSQRQQNGNVDVCPESDVAKTTATKSNPTLPSQYVSTTTNQHHLRIDYGARLGRGLGGVGVRGDERGEEREEREERGDFKPKGDLSPGDDCCENGLDNSPTIVKT